MHQLNVGKPKKEIKLTVFPGKAKQQCFERKFIVCRLINTEAETCAYLVITL